MLIINWYIDYTFNKEGRMKKLLITLGALCIISLPSMASEPFGLIYQNTTHQLLGSGSVNPAKVGKSKSKCFFGLVAVGDCSVKTAMTNGKIKSLSHADQHVKCICGYRVIETRAYGQ